MHTVIPLRFRVVEGGLLDIRLLVHDPQGYVLREKLEFFNKERDEGVMDIKTTMRQGYFVCFDNTMSRWTDKVVEFTIEGDISFEAIEEVPKPPKPPLFEDPYVDKAKKNGTG